MQYIRSKSMMVGRRTRYTAANGRAFSCCWKYLIFCMSICLMYLSEKSVHTIVVAAFTVKRGLLVKQKLVMLPLAAEKSPQSSHLSHKNGKSKVNGSRSDPASELNEWGIPNSSTLPSLHESSIGAPVSVLRNGGRVTLVGSGPGDPDLLTVSAYKLLVTADENTVIIADRLVSSEILDLIPRNAQLHNARKLPGCADLAQEEIYYKAHTALQQGKHVIRLKIGDPFVFGRGGEEVLTFRRLGVEPTVIPGVSAAFSAPLLGSIPVTHRGVSNQVVMCTGYGREGTSPDLIQYHAEQTVVFLMAVGRLRELCDRLVRLAHYPIQTPVGIVEKAGCPNQRTVVGTLETIAELAEKYNVQPPSTIVVGEVVNVLLDKDEKTNQHITGLIQNATASALSFA